MTKKKKRQITHTIIKQDKHFFGHGLKIWEDTCPLGLIGHDATRKTAIYMSKAVIITNWLFTDWLILNCKCNVCTTSINTAVHLKTEETEWVLFGYYSEV